MQLTSPAILLLWSIDLVSGRSCLARYQICPFRYAARSTTADLGRNHSRALLLLLKRLDRGG